VKVYTKGGDRGETSLAGGPRVSKDDPRVEAYGSVDELNALLGLVSAELEGGELREQISRIQHSLFDMGGELATPDIDERERRGKVQPRVRDSDVAEIESWIDRVEADLEPIRHFVLPAGTRAAALLHVARAVCRRAERRVVALGASEIDLVLVRYLNRLSDFLFVLARAANRSEGVPDVVWKGRGR
jgi:cob(I)alamin adenosyltransferase